MYTDTPSPTRVFQRGFAYDALQNTGCHGLVLALVAAIRVGGRCPGLALVARAAGSGSVEQGNYPVRFGTDRFLWRTELPGKGCSTPILLNGMIYLTSPVDANDALLCYDSHGGEKWRAVFSKENPGKHRNGSGCNASPVTDGKAVFVYFKSGALAAVDLDGKVRWKTDLVERFGKDTLFWDHGTSPVLTDRYVVMARMHQGESWLAAFDKESGEMAWKVARNYSTPTECDHGYATPLVIQHQGRESILVWGAEHLTIHNATDGQVSWSCGNFNPDANKLWPAIATPVIVGDMVVIAYGRNDRGIPRLHGIRLTGSGDVTETNHVWKRDDVGTFVPTPAVYKGRVILVRDRGEVACIDPATGKTIWEGSVSQEPGELLRLAADCRRQAVRAARGRDRVCGECRQRQVRIVVRKRHGRVRHRFARPGLELHLDPRRKASLLRRRRGLATVKCARSPAGPTGW